MLEKMSSIFRRGWGFILRRIKWDERIYPSVYRWYQEVKIKKIRKKEKIRVLFIIAELGAWKTESLYVAMLKHPRFEPVIGITKSLEVPGSKVPLKAYLENKDYPYIDLDLPGQNIDDLAPDIKFYYKPYAGSYPAGIYFDHHKQSLVCNIFYGFSQGGSPYCFNHSIWRYSWKSFVENSIVINTAKSIKGACTDNMVVTGIPMQDQLGRDKSLYQDPWKHNGDKKRIIYAPHHSFKGTNGTHIEYATFLEFGVEILKIAKKYSTTTQWAFKPHPTLYPKLIKIWGKERTDNYYREWRDLQNTQLELGEYAGLFKHSDAMIHDCCSFIVEYMYSDNPVLYLEDAPKTAQQLQLGEFGFNAYKVHYHASNITQVENFINDVVNGVDCMKEQRRDYFKKYLLPPNGQTACENILEVILGEGHYK